MTNTSLRRLRSGLAGFVGLVLILSGCTVLGHSPDEEPPPEPSPLPASQFPLIPDRKDTGANDFVTRMATDQETTVAVGTVLAASLVPTFRYSEDDGLTWRQGRLSEAAERESTIGEQTSGVLAVRPDGEGSLWIAFGSSDVGRVLWSSRDGRTWDRHDIDEQIRADEFSVHDVTVAGGLFVAVGARNRAGEPDRPATWTSPDGLHWTASTPPGRGALVSVAAHEGRVVAVGSERRPEGEPQQVPVALWSADPAGTWTPVEVPRPNDDDQFVSYLSEVVATESGFRSVGSVWTDQYVPYTQVSEDGRAWRNDPQSPELRTGDGAYGGGLVARSKTTVVGIDLPNEVRKVGLLRRDAYGWTAARVPSSKGADDRTVSQLLATGDALLAVLDDQQNGRVRTTIWRSEDHGSTFSEVVFEPAAENVPLVAPYGLVRHGDVVAFGRSQALPVVWRRDADGQFAEPVVVEAAESTRVDVAASNGDQLLLAGTVRAHGNDNARVWSSTDGKEFTATDRDTFEEAGPFADSAISDVARLRDRWYVVGRRTANGAANRSALVHSSADGRRWAAGRAATSTTPKGQEYALSALSGTRERERSMSAITEAGKHLVVVGHTRSHSANRPAVWRSSDGDTWHLHELEAPGHTSARLSDVAADGDLLVATGVGTRKDALESEPMVWISTDAGARWSEPEGPLRGPDAALTAQPLPAGGVLLVGSDGEPMSTPRMFRSDDGTRWNEVAVAGQPAGSGQEKFVEAVLPGGEGDPAVALIALRNRTDEAYELVEQPLE